MSDIAHVLFPGVADVRVPYTTDGQAINDLFTDAHNALHNRGDFRTTKLAFVLPEVIRTCKTIALWWGDEWSDLPVVDEEAALVQEIIINCESRSETYISDGNGKNTFERVARHVAVRACGLGLHPLDVPEHRNESGSARLLGAESRRRKGADNTDCLESMHGRYYDPNGGGSYRSIRADERVRRQARHAPRPPLRPVHDHERG